MLNLWGGAKLEGCGVHVNTKEMVLQGKEWLSYVYFCKQKELLVLILHTTQSQFW